jgi:Ca2+/Na+ antiporter
MRKSTTIAVGVFLGACFASLTLAAPITALAQGSNTTTDSNQQKNSHHHSHQGNKGGAASGAQQRQQ